MHTAHGMFTYVTELYYGYTKKDAYGINERCIHASTQICSVHFGLEMFSTGEIHNNNNIRTMPRMTLCMYIEPSGYC